ncbi:MAG: radical SAM protein [Armatimonadetes bacterium]|nr:radical SAM protein [Armatimonadota bacterium]
MAAARAAIARERLHACTLCPRRCGKDRSGAERGECGLGSAAVVASHGPHFGEEPPLVGWGGSGAVFFSGCNLHCVFCQNHDISQSAHGETVEADRLAGIFLELQTRGCHNLNLVSPTHVVAAILAALALASERGLHLPVVYNCGGYESLDTLALLDGLVDIYMPDFKYGVEGPDRLYSAAPGYPGICRAALREMHRQVGDLKVDELGLARRGLLLRHLVLPGGLAGSRAVAEFVANEISANTYVNVMGQYRPSHRAAEHPELTRRPTTDELAAARELFREAGLTRLAR